jgi:mannose-6-phosphate isomerase
MSIRQPLRLEPIFLEKIWGGRALQPLLPEGLPVDKNIGEAWCLADREGATSMVAEGPFKGRTLGGLMLSEETALLGRTQPDPDGSFPLLLKLLDARKNLSIQVHPDHATAERMGPSFAGKDECWLVLSADEDAEVFLGLSNGTTASEFAEAAGTSDVVALLTSYPVRSGDFVRVPAGTVHSIGKGLVIIEVQQNSDTTFRIYDWDRKDQNGELREQHVESALSSIIYDQAGLEPGPPEWREQGTSMRASLFEDESYQGELLRIHELFERDTDKRAGALFVISGQGRIRVSGEEEEQSWSIRSGQTWLLPADLGPHDLLPEDGDFQVLALRSFRGRQS